MTELTDSYILDKMSKARKKEFEPQFSLDDLVGKTIQEYRKIINPRKYDQKRESPNPEYFDALIFSDKTFLVIENFEKFKFQNSLRRTLLKFPSEIVIMQSSLLKNGMMVNARI